MAPVESELTTTHDVKSVYALDEKQVTRASKALLKHISEQPKSEDSKSSKKNLLQADESDEDEAEAGNEVPIWLILTTKKHIVDKKRLKPTKMYVPPQLLLQDRTNNEKTTPNPLITSSNTNVCLITADPQRTYKDLRTAPSFPQELAMSIQKVIGLSKLKAKYKSYESRRQLRAEHDLFLADERIITSLPAVLGKAFYKSTGKRPIPVCLTGNERFEKDENGRKIKPKGGDAKQGKLVGTPVIVAKEIERTFNMTLVSLSPSTTTAVQVGRANFTAEQIVQNVEKVVEEMTKRVVPQGWRNLKSIHIKGPETMAIPVWLANELWVDEGDVLEEGEGESIEKKKGKKRKRKDGGKDSKELKENADVDEDKAEEKARKEKIKKAKTRALKDDSSLAIAAA